MTLSQMIALQSMGFGIPTHQFQYQCQIQVVHRPDTPQPVPIPGVAPLFALSVLILLSLKRGIR